MNQTAYQLWFWPLAAQLVLLAGLSYYYQQRRHAFRRRGGRARLYRCGGCARVYEDRRNVPLSACPGCGRLNEAVTGK